MVKLGDRVKDIISGFEGIATGRIEYLYGCSQIQIVPETMDKDGKKRDAQWLNEQRVVIVEALAIKVSPDSRPTTEIPGGDHDDYPDPADNCP